MRRGSRYLAMLCLASMFCLAAGSRGQQPTPAPDNTPTPAAPKAVICRADRSPAVSPIDAPAGRRTKLFIDGSSGVAFHWVIQPPELADDAADMITADGRRVLDIVPSGTGPLYCTLVAVGSGGQVSTSSVTVNSGTKPKPNPKPNPNPTPNPPKPPSPTGLCYQVVIVRETADQTPAQGKILNDQEVRAKTGGRWYMIDKDRAVGDAAGWVRAVPAGGSLPYAFFVSAKGDVIWEGKLPADKAAMLAQMNKFKWE